MQTFTFKLLKKKQVNKLFFVLFQIHISHLPWGSDDSYPRCMDAVVESGSF